MKALIVGATGATGKDLLEQLLNDSYFKQVDIFVRRKLNIEHKKLKIHVIDFDKPEQWHNLVKGDVLFSCLGTTLKAAGSKEAQRRVDYLYQYQFAEAARQNGVETYVLVSAAMASSKSNIFYSRIKGELEDDVKALKFPKLVIFNPPVLVRKESDRGGEVKMVKVMNFISSLGLFKSSKPLPTASLAKAMIASIKKLGKGEHQIKGQDILNYVD